MSLINVTDVQVLDNPTKFTNPFQFEITFECLPPGVQEELEWKLTYVGSATDEKYDQELDSVLVGPVVVGKNKFVFGAPAPDPTLIPKDDIMEVTVLLLTASYKDKEFIRIGYYVNTEINPAEVALCAERDAWLGRCTALQQQHQEVLQQIRAQQESLNAAADAAMAAAAAAGQAPPESARVVLPTPPEPTMPPSPAIDITKLQRNILADKPRVTRFTVPWDEPQAKEFAMDAADEAKAASDASAAESAAASGSAAADVEDDGAEEDESEDDEEGEMDDVGETEVADEEEEAGEEEGEEEEEEMTQTTGQQRMEA